MFKKVKDKVSKGKKNAEEGQGDQVASSESQSDEESEEEVKGPESPLNVSADEAIEFETGFADADDAEFVRPEVDRTASLLGNIMKDKLDFQQDGKKADTILTPDCDVITTGSMLIVLVNSQTSHPCNMPITGKIKVNLTEPFDAKALTLNLSGYERSQFNPTQGRKFRFDPNYELIRLAKKLLSVDFEVAKFPEGEVQNGQKEYAFSLTLPSSVNETLMLQLLQEQNNFSITHYLSAQLEPRNKADYAKKKNKISKLRTDYALYLYRPPGFD